jgi:hypothetical protein
MLKMPILKDKNFQIAIEYKLPVRAQADIPF